MKGYPKQFAENPMMDDSYWKDMDEQITRQNAESCVRSAIEFRNKTGNIPYRHKIDRKKYTELFPSVVGYSFCIAAPWGLMEIVSK